MNPDYDKIMHQLGEADPALDAPSSVEEDRAEQERIRTRALALAEATSPESVQRHRSRRGRSRIAARPRLVAALAAAGIIAAIVLVGRGDLPSGEGRAYAMSAVRVAEANPRLLLDAPGWAVTRANEFEPNQGEIEFGDGHGRLTIRWAPAASYLDPSNDIGGSRGEEGQWYRLLPMSCALGSGDGAQDCTVFERYSDITVLGGPARLGESTFVERGRVSNNLTTTLPPAGRVWLSIEATSMPRSEYVALLGSLQETDVNTWLAALPPAVVQPLERPELVDEMLSGVPVPASLDVEQLKGEPAASSRYDLGAAVTSAASCGWLDQWASAIETGDTAAAAEAVKAMSTSRDWPILEEMASEGGWSQTIWEYARDLSSGDRQALLGVAGTEYAPNGDVYELSPSYAAGLGCDSEQRILREGDPQTDGQDHPTMGLPPGLPPLPGTGKTPVTAAEVARAVAAVRSGG